MYIPAHNKETDLAVIHGLIRERPFAAWITQGADGLVANHIPFLIDPARGPYGTLIGHVARANPIWRTFSTTTPSLVIFQGTQGYITPAWYPSKLTDTKTVPTWNYTVVHAHGIPRAIEDTGWLLNHVTQLSDTHEAAQAHPWKVTDAPREYIDAMLRGIVGIEIPIDRIEGKWKVSQNRTAEDKQGVIAGLAALGDDESTAMSALVRRYAEKSERKG